VFILCMRLAQPVQHTARLRCLVVEQPQWQHSSLYILLTWSGSQLLIGQRLCQLTARPLKASTSACHHLAASVRDSSHKLQCSHTAQISPHCDARPAAVLMLTRTCTASPLATALPPPPASCRRMTSPSLPAG
jgi:hypothetical protein